MGRPGPAPLVRCRHHLGTGDRRAHQQAGTDRPMTAPPVIDEDGGVDVVYSAVHTGLAR